MWQWLAAALHFWSIVTLLHCKARSSVPVVISLSSISMGVSPHWYSRHAELQRCGVKKKAFYPVLVSSLYEYFISQWAEKSCLLLPSRSLACNRMLLSNTVKEKFIVQCLFYGASVVCTQLWKNCGFTLRESSIVPSQEGVLCPLGPPASSLNAINDGAIPLPCDKWSHSIMYSHHIILPNWQGLKKQTSKGKICMRWILFLAQQWLASIVLLEITATALTDLHIIKEK